MTLRRYNKLIRGKNIAGTAKNAYGETESILASKVIAFLSKNGFKVWRQENSGKLDDEQVAEKVGLYVDSLLSSKQIITRSLVKENVNKIVSTCYKKVEGSVRGVADVIGWRKTDGKFIAVEIKINNDTLSESQKTWLHELQKSKGITVVAKSYQGFLETYYENFPQKEFKKEPNLLF
jgi:hypothetical protein